MQTPRHAITKAVVSVFFAFGALSIALNASATVKVISVSGASKYTFGSASITPGATPPPISGNPTVYAGTAGVTMGTTKHSSPDGLPFDTCKFADAQFPFVACNNAAIDGNVTLTFQYTADKAGYPVLIDTTANIRIPPTGPVQSYAAGATGIISFKWSDICTKMNGTTGAQVNQDCEVISTQLGNGNHTFQLGVNATDPNALTSDDTAATVTVIASSQVGQDQNGESKVSTCEDAGAYGLCHFAIKNGDGKVALTSLKKAGAFPSGGGGGLASQSLVLLWVPATGPDDTASAATITAASVTPASTRLTVTQNTAGELSLSPSRIPGFTNDQYYVFKVAVEDLAGNIGYFTSTPTGDTYCIYAPNPAATNCHIGHPGEVVGVLSEPVQCYIATAAYGSPLASQVEAFREFRNEVLMRMKWGSRFVKFYYEHSPKYARIIAQSDSLRALARLSLWPALAFAKLSLELGFEAAIVISLATLCAIAFGLTFSIRIVRKYRRETKCQAAR